MVILIMGMQKMTQTMENYFRYLPTTPEILDWGLAVSAAGYTRVPPHVSYPPAAHPEDHALDWNHGRVIDALQVVLVSEGGGWLETDAMRRRRVEAGMVFLILPHAWHRYRPDPETGWTESWIEARGPVIENLLRNATFPPASALRNGAIDAGIEETLNRIHQRIGGDPPGRQPELSALALQVLAQCSTLTAGASRTSRIQRAVHRAERHLNDHYREAIQMESLAAQLGVAYSHFRRAYRAHTGFSPWQYVIHLRLTRARSLMSSGDATLDDIAARTGFSSGFHLSNSFKQTYGISPDHWRKNLISRVRQGGIGSMPDDG